MAKNIKEETDMADQTMTVVVASKAGLLDMAAHASALAGNAVGSDKFLIPNDGKTVLFIQAVTGDTWTVTAVACSHGRTETLTNVVAAGKQAMLGPWNPEMFNNASGQVALDPTVGNAGDKLLAVRVG